MVSKEQRRRQLAREKYERQQQRRTERRARTRRRTAMVALAVAIVFATGGTLLASGMIPGDDGGKDVKAQATPKPSRAPDPCRKAAPGTPGKGQWKKEPALTVDRNATYTAALETTCGRITLELDPDKAPHTVNSFVFLAGQKYFDHTRCHRVTTQGIYVLQCGDPTGTGQGGPGYRLEDENLDDRSVAKGVYPAGTVAMANAGADTGGSQFFLVYRDSPLPPKYTPFGRIRTGTEVLKRIAKAGERSGTGDGAPRATVVVDRFTVTRA